ncbi:hypothetical protein Sjap_014117 [Stephania japonica]|uniref:Uncharacterized protein n=1 Tax=Stephania japonica TaxID=461633 RepID=A0AAP0J0I2_9MAGN
MLCTALSPNTYVSLSSSPSPLFTLSQPLSSSTTPLLTALSRHPRSLDLFSPSRPH